MGRTKLESHLLSSARSSIAKATKGGKPHINIYGLLVAYADASGLVPYRMSATEGDPVANMKVRLSRVKSSRTGIHMLSIVLAQMVKSTVASVN